MVIAIRYFADDAEATQKLEELSVSTPKPAEEDEVLPGYSSPPGRCCCSAPPTRVHVTGEEAARWQDQEEGEAASSLDEIDEK